MNYRKNDFCRACGGNDLDCFLSLGPTPLANSFLKTEEDFDDELVFPLDVYFCGDCSLVQLLDVVDPEILFRDYVYTSGISETMAEHRDEFLATATDVVGLNSNDLVVEIGSNDGSLLSRFSSLGVRSLGIEPASNIAEMANAQGIRTLNLFFDSKTAKEVREQWGAAKVVVANNVLAHVDATRDFLTGCKNLLHEDGMLIAEVPYLQDLLDRLEYDTIYHEHLCYFSVSALSGLFHKVGLSLVRVDHVPVHGGSLRLFARRAMRGERHSDQVEFLVENETRAGLTELKRYNHFADQVRNNRESIRELLTRLKSKGYSIAAYGAPAKGNTLLNYCHIDRDLIPFTVDKSPMKIGLFTPGSHIPVLPVTALLDRRPDYLLILAWNLADEIMSQQKEFRVTGGKFIVPVPKPEVL